MNKFFFLGTISAAVLFIATFAACNSTEEIPLERKDNVAMNISKNEINEDFLAYLEDITTPVSSRSFNGIVTEGKSLSNVKWDTNKAIQVKDYGKNLEMQFVPAIGEIQHVAGAYYQISKPNSSPMILQMKETSKDIFMMLDENGSPLLEMTYDPITNTAVCTKVVSKKDVTGILCGGAMAALGWEVGVILAVPSGGSSLAFSLLWSVVSYTACA